MSKKNKIDDFGEFIPGCYKHHGAMTYEEFMNMSEAEQRLRARRESVWKPIEAESLVASGEDNFIVYMKHRIRLLTYAVPKVFNEDEFKETAAEYIKSLSALRDAVMDLKDDTQLYDFLKDKKNHKEYTGCIDILNLGRFRYNLSSLRDRCIKMNYPYNKRKTQEKRKETFKLAPLESVERTGPDYRNGDVKEKEWEQNFKFRGVVFGASVPQKERQDDLNYGYDGIMDMAYALDITNASMSFDGRLGISFGARGRGHASGHYECISEVINMTRLRGAGTFAKLWFHALDDALAKFCGIKNGKLASEADENERKRLPHEFNVLIDALKYDDIGRETCFHLGSSSFDKHFFGKWDKTAEMAARAFACYLKDTINAKSDYVIAHADAYQWEYENEKLYAIPQGEERDLFNELFDSLFSKLKKMGFLHARAAEKKNPENHTVKKEKAGKEGKMKKVSKQNHVKQFLFRIEDNGQLSLV